MADSKENYQGDLGSERFKIYCAPYWTICIWCNLQKFDTYYVLFYFWLLLNTERNDADPQVCRLSLYWSLVSLIQMQVLPYPVYFHSAAVTPSGYMYVFGGVKTINSNEATRSNDVFRLCIAWQPLVERCWEVVTSCLEGKRNFHTDLKNLGVPHHFLERLK